MTAPDPEAFLAEFLSRARPSSPDEYEAKVSAAQLFRPTPVSLLPADTARTLAMAELDLQGWRPPDEIDDDDTASDGALRIGEIAIFNILSESGNWGEFRVAQLCEVHRNCPKHDDGSLTLASDRWHHQRPKREGGPVARYSTFWKETIPPDRIMGIQSLPYAVRPGDLVFAVDASGECLLAEKIGEITPAGIVSFWDVPDDPKSRNWSEPHSGRVVRWEDITEFHVIIRGEE